MKLSNQFNTPLVIPQVNTDTSQQKTQIPPGIIQAPNKEPELVTRKTDYGYPEATPEERVKRGARFGGFGKGGGIGGGGKSRGDKFKNDKGHGSAGRIRGGKDKSKVGSSYHKTKQKLPGGPNSPANAAHKTQAINELQRRGFFPPLPSGLGAVAGNAIVEATLSGLVRLAFTPVQHAVSDAMEQRIKAQTEMPGAEKKNADGTKSTVDPSATEQQKMDARLEGAEINVELLANSIISISEGPNADGVGKSPNAPTTTGERLDNLEKILDAAERPLEDIARRYGQVYTRPDAADVSKSTPQSRMDRIEQRYAEMNKMLKRLVAVKEAEALEAE
ncbi:hypothetical protein [uncultured Pseudomonas sp.]|uniref:hypothetical protein n=1 Tax=uncultured Pseudomonas sp. TaxID=114707 RepID=UPI0025F721AD|nr:hypothetical protein [uncultured Pseudomonas sp.]